MKISRGVIAGGVVALVIIGGGAYGWREWTHSPTYSLKAVAAAVEHRDRYEFERYVDVDMILQSFLADAADGNPLASAIGGAVMTSLKPQIIKAIEDGSIPTESQFGQGIQKTLGSQLPPIDRQGRNAYFSIPVTTKGGAPFALKIHMTQVPDGYWRIDRLANVKELRSLEDQEEKLRKAAIAKANEEKIGKLHVTAKLHTSITEGWDKKNRFQIRFENKGDTPIASFSGRIRMPAQEYKHDINGKAQIAPGATTNLVWEFDENRFIPDTVRAFAAGETDQVDVDIESLTYADGTTVKRGSDEP